MIQVRKESDYLIISNKKRFEELVSSSVIDSEDIVDALISLHIVLEVSLNTLYRHLSLSGIKKNISQFEIINNLDQINFIEKTVLFIYNSKFNFGDKIEKASEYHKIIGTLRDFSGARNKLLHGHSISTIFDGERNSNSNTKQMLTVQYLNEQIKKFKFILEGLRFYIDHLDSTFTEAGKDSYKNAYLDDSFISNLITN